MAMEKCSGVGFMLSEREEDVVVGGSAEVDFRVDQSEKKRLNMNDN